MKVLLALVAVILVQPSCTSTPSPEPVGAKDDPTYIARANETLRQNVGHRQQPSESNAESRILAERLRAVFPEVMERMRQFGGKSVVAPQLVSFSVPDYPEEFRSAHMEATLRVAIVIGVDGNVRDAAALQDIGPAMTKPVLEAVRKWKYKPALVNGLPAEYLVIAPFNFKLKRTTLQRQ